MKKNITLLSLLVFIIIGHCCVTINGETDKKQEHLGDPGDKPNESSVSRGYNAAAKVSRRSYQGPFFGPPLPPPPLYGGPIFVGPQHFGGPFPHHIPHVVGYDGPRTLPGWKGFNFGFSKFNVKPKKDDHDDHHDD